MLGVLLYAVTVPGTFVYDDVLLLMLDERLGPQIDWLAYLTDGYHHGVDNLYRPLTSLSFALQYRFAGLTAWPYHLVNVLLYGGCCGMVAATAGRLARLLGTRRTASKTPGINPPTVALLAGLLFAVHPVHVEAVAGIYGRAELLCTLFMLAAVWLAAAAPSPWRLAAILAAVVLAVASKEQGMLTPAVLGLLGLAAWRRGLFPLPDTDGRRRHKLLAALLMLFLAAYVVWRETILRFWWPREFLDAVKQPFAAADGLDRWLLPFSVLGRAAATLLWPARLSIDYGQAVITPDVTPGDVYLWLGALTLLAGLAAGILAWRRRNWLVLFSLAATAVVWAPAANVLTLVGTPFGDRLLFLPSAFLAIATATLLARLPRRGLMALLALLLTAGAVRTLDYALAWRDRLTLYEAVVAAQPKSVMNRQLLAEELARRGQFDEARAQAGEAIKLAPWYPNAHYTAAAVELYAGDLAAAERFLAAGAVYDVSMMQMGISHQIERARAGEPMPTLAE